MSIDSVSHLLSVEVCIINSLAIKYNTTQYVAIAGKDPGCHDPKTQNHVNLELMNLYYEFGVPTKIVF